MNPSAFFVRAGSAFLLFGLALDGWSSDDAVYHRERGSEIVRAIQPTQRHSVPIPRAFQPQDPVAIAGSFLKGQADVLGPAVVVDDLRLRFQRRDASGLTRVLFLQEHEGVPVYDGQYTVHLDSAMNVVRAVGKLAPAPAVDTRPTLTREQAIEQAKAILRERGLATDGLKGKAELFVLDLAMVTHGVDERSILTWRVTLGGAAPPRLEYLFIDAHDGQLRRQLTGLRRVIDRRVVDCELSGTCDDAYVAYFSGSSCPTFSAEHVRVEGESAFGNADVDELYGNLGHVGGFYESLGMNGANGYGGLEFGTCFAPSVTAAYARIEDDFPGWCPNAFSIGPAIFFCSGGFTELSIVAHEYTHSVDFYNVWDSYGPYGLEYQDESGALNESFADVMGMGVETRAYGVTDWIEGGIVYVPEWDWYLDIRRSLRDPKEFPQLDETPYPDRFYDPEFYCRNPNDDPCDSNDYGGVHSNNMVPSKAAYLAAEGGTFNGCSVSGIGIAKQQAIWQLAHVGGYLTVTSDFNAAYDAFLFACEDLYGSGSSECAQVAKALQAVELDQPGRCSGVPAATPACALPSPTPTPTANPSPTPSPSPEPTPSPTPTQPPDAGPDSSTAMLLMSPNGGETFRLGERIGITWRFADAGPRKLLTLKWSKDAGRKWKLLKNVKNSGFASWKPKAIHVSDRLRLMICAPPTQTKPRVCDVSDEDFSLQRR